MGLVRTWTGQVARAAGASLLAPLVLLLAAGAVASGGGLGGFGSLGEISSGPSLPDTGLTTAPGRALDDAQIVGVDLAPTADVAEAPASPAGPMASAATPGAGRAAAVRPPGSGEQGVAGNTLEPQRPLSPGAGEVSPPTTSPAPQPAPPAPGGDLGEVTRGLGDAVRAPLDPLTDAIIQLLRGSPPR